jgi:hypothetical protein
VSSSLSENCGALIVIISFGNEAYGDFEGDITLGDEEPLLTTFGYSDFSFLSFKPPFWKYSFSTLSFLIFELSIYF